MNKQPIEDWYGIPEANPALSGCDYVALVIEWNDSEAIDDQPVKTESSPQQLVTLPLRKIAAAVGALAAILFAYSVWDHRRHRPIHA